MILSMLCVLGVSAWALLGEAEIPAGWANSATTVANMGFLGWFAWYTTTRTLPKMAEDFRAALDKQQAASDRMLTEFRQDCDRRQAEILQKIENIGPRHRA